MTTNQQIVAQKMLGLVTVLCCFPASAVRALPPADDIPEEILRTEIILEGRSPVDGKLLSAAEYEELQAQLAQSRYRPELAPKVQEIIFLLQIRKMIKTIIPFY